MKRLWLIFAQTVTIGVGALFVLQTLKPAWLPKGAAESAPLVAPLPALPADPPKDRSGDSSVISYAPAARKAVPSVVHIYTSQQVRTPRNPFADDPFFRHFFGDRAAEQTQRRAGLGSGVVVNAEGYVLTNNHVVDGADAIEVALNDGRKLKAKVVGTDPETDLAVIRITAPEKLPVIQFATTNSVHVGDVVLAIGNPFGVGQTVTSGIVSALGRSHLGINTFENFIQTDAAINPGNSGGALVDSNGNLVGINTAIYSQSGGSMGIGFAIPVSLAKGVLDQIIRTGAVTRGWVGVEIQEITPDLAESFNLPATSGALIAGVMRGSPADKAGLKPGDVLLAIDGAPVRDAQSMLENIAALEPGSTSHFAIRRAKQDVDVRVVIGKRPRPTRS